MSEILSLAAGCPTWWPSALRCSGNGECLLTLFNGTTLPALHPLSRLAAGDDALSASVGGWGCHCATAYTGRSDFIDLTNRDCHTHLAAMVLVYTVWSWVALVCAGLAAVKIAWALRQLAAMMSVPGAVFVVRDMTDDEEEGKPAPAGGTKRRPHPGSSAAELPSTTVNSATITVQPLPDYRAADAVPSISLAALLRSYFAQRFSVTLTASALGGVASVVACTVHAAHDTQRLGVAPLVSAVNCVQWWCWQAAALEFLHRFVRSTVAAAGVDAGRARSLLRSTRAAFALAAAALSALAPAIVAMCFLRAHATEMTKALVVLFMCFSAVMVQCCYCSAVLYAHVEQQGTTGLSGEQLVARTQQLKRLRTVKWFFYLITPSVVGLPPVVLALPVLYTRFNYIWPLSMCASYAFSVILVAITQVTISGAKPASDRAAPVPPPLPPPAASATTKWATTVSPAAGGSRGARPTRVVHVAPARRYQVKAEDEGDATAD